MTIGNLVIAIMICVGAMPLLALGLMALRPGQPEQSAGKSID